MIVSQNKGEVLILPAGNEKAPDRPPSEVAGDAFSPGILRQPEKKEDLLKKIADRKGKFPLVRTSLDMGLKFFKGMAAFPRFVYPSLINMTDKEKALFISTLDKLSLRDIGSVQSMTVVSDLSYGGGLSIPVPSSHFIIFDRKELVGNGKIARAVITHEVGHTRDFDTGISGLLGFESRKSPWGKPPFISDYAGSAPYEDFAESFENYHMNPEKLKVECPEKFERLRELEKSGFLERFIDNRAFRETGKFVGRALERAPYLQNALSMITFLAGFAQAHKGLNELRLSNQSGDARLKMNGILDFAAGACFATGFFLMAGMALDGMKRELNRAVDRNEITGKQSEAVIQSTLGVIVGPVGNAINWVRSKLPWNRKDGIGEKKISLEEDSTPVQSDLKKAAGIAIGAACGASAGSFIGTWLGVMGGFALAGPLGGFLGLIAGTLGGIYGGTRLGGELGKALGAMRENRRLTKAADEPIGWLDPALS